MNYLMPLIQGSPDIIMRDGLPAYIEPYFMRGEAALVSQ